MQAGNNDFKYVIQDFMHLFIGAKYTFEEIMENEDIPFKFRSIIGNYLLKEYADTTSLEEYLKQMRDKDMVYRIFVQLKVKVKTKNKYFTLDEFMELTKNNREDYFVEEIMLSKLNLMAISV